MELLKGFIFDLQRHDYAEPITLNEWAAPAGTATEKYYKIDGQMVGEGEVNLENLMGADKVIGGLVVNPLPIGCPHL